MHLVEHLYQGGIERLLEQLAMHTPPEEQRLLFCTYHTKELSGIGKDLENHGLPVFCYDKGPGYDLSLVRFLVNIVEREQIDVVHTHDFGPMEYAVALKLRFPHLRLVHTHHTVHDFLRYRRYMLFFQLASFFYHKIIGVSPYVTDTLAKSCPLSRPRLHTIYNGLDVKSFGALKHDFSNDRLRIVNVSRISKEKNLLHLLRACAELKKAGVAFELHHAGSGTPTEEKPIHEFIRAHGLEEEVTLHGFRADVRPLLAAGDIFVSPSLTEGHPVAVIEAMAAGLLVLCSDIPAHRLLSEKGIFFFDLQSDALARQLKKIAATPGFGRERIAIARKEVKLRFCLDRMIQDYGSTYAYRS